MIFMDDDNKPERRKIGFLGMRVFKTSLSVYLCFLFALLRDVSPLHSTFAAIISTKTDHQYGLRAGKERIIGTCLGGFFGFITIIFIDILNINPISHLAYIIYSIALIPVIYTNVNLEAPETVPLSSIVFISIVLSARGMSAISIVLSRIIETLIGVFISIFINFIL